MNAFKNTHVFLLALTACTGFTAHAMDADAIKSFKLFCTTVNNRKDEATRFKYAIPFTQHCMPLVQALNENNNKLKQEQEKEYVLANTLGALVGAESAVIVAIAKDDLKNLSTMVEIQKNFEQELVDLGREDLVDKSEHNALIGYRFMKDSCTLFSDPLNTQVRKISKYAGDFSNECKPFFKAMDRALKAEKCDLEKDSTYKALPGFFASLQKHEKDFSIVSILSRIVLSEAAITVAEHQGDHALAKQERKNIKELERHLRAMGYKSKSTGITF